MSVTKTVSGVLCPGTCFASVLNQVKKKKKKKIRDKLDTSTGALFIQAEFV